VLGTSGLLDIFERTAILPSSNLGLPSAAAAEPLPDNCQEKLRWSHPSPLLAFYLLLPEDEDLFDIVGPHTQIMCPAAGVRLESVFFIMWCDIGHVGE